MKSKSIKRGLGLCLSFGTATYGVLLLVSIFALGFEPDTLLGIEAVVLGAMPVFTILFFISKMDESLIFDSRFKKIVATTLAICFLIPFALSYVFFFWRVLDSDLLTLSTAPVLSMVGALSLLLGGIQIIRFEATRSQTK